MKYILFISILLLVQFTISSAQYDKCYTCLKEGDKCDPSSNQKCPSGTGCYKPGKDYECYRLPTTVGASCLITQKCSGRLQCNTTSNICYELAYKGYGESCTETSQCNGILECVQGKCINTQYPKCLGADDDCNGINEFCSESNHTCLTKYQDGENCLSHNECKIGSLCFPRLNNYRDKICKKQGTLIEGEICYSSSISCDISLGLVCDNKNGTCVKFSSYSNKTCGETGSLYDACPDLTACMCETSGPLHSTCKPVVDIDSKTQNIYFNWVDCVLNSGCTWDSNTKPSSCLSKCGEDPLSDVYDNVYTNPCGKLITGDASNTLINTFIFGFILIISLLI